MQSSESNDMSMSVKEFYRKCFVVAFCYWFYVESSVMFFTCLTYAIGFTLSEFIVLILSNGSQCTPNSLSHDSSRFQSSIVSPELISFISLFCYYSKNVTY